MQGDICAHFAHVADTRRSLLIWSVVRFVLNVHKPQNIFFICVAFFSEFFIVQRRKRPKVAYAAHFAQSCKVFPFHSTTGRFRYSLRCDLECCGVHSVIYVQITSKKCTSCLWRFRYVMAHKVEEMTARRNSRTRRLGRLCPRPVTACGHLFEQLHDFRHHSECDSSKVVIALLL